MRICVLTSLFVLAAAPAPAATIVCLIGEREYGTRETLPEWGNAVLEPAGHRCIYIHAVTNDRKNPAAHRFPGAALIDEADLLILSTRRRALPKQDLDRVRRHIADGKPVIALRTASHGFHARGEGPAGHEEWEEFDRDVLGADYENHLKNESTTLTISPGAEAHPVAAGFDRFESTGSLYRFVNVQDGVTVLIEGSTSTPDGEFTYPAVWVRETPAGGRVFSAALGGTGDFAEPKFRELLERAVAWCLGSL